MRWKIPDSSYLNFLRENYDKRIPYTDYGVSTVKPFFGELFTVGELIYLTQISHPQPRHIRMKSNMDFEKIYRDNGKLMTIINLNYMFPIHKSLVSDLNYDEIDKYITFSDVETRRKRINFLSIQLREINRLNIDVKARLLYEHKYTFPDDAISQRCLDFKKLENASAEYIDT